MALDVPGLPSCVVSAGLPSDAGRRFCIVQLDPARAAFLSPRKERLSSCLSFPGPGKCHCWDNWIFSSSAVAAHSEGLSCPLISPEAPPKSCDLERSKHPPALCSGHPTHLPDTWHCSKGLAEGKHCTGTWWNLISGLHILAFGFESNALPVKWPLERSILGTPDLEPWLKCPSGVCGESFMELNYITRLLSPWTRVHAAPTN